MTQKSVHFRVQWDEYEHLCAEAQKRKIAPMALAKMIHRESMAGYDRRHEVLLEEIEQLRASVATLQALVSKTAVFAAGAVAAAAIPPGMATSIPEGMKDQVRGHISASVREGRRIDRAFDDGRFDTERGDVASN
ncbi:MULTISPECIES: hypothetical protein [Burkholderia]|uniref:Uncharacterized protein n=1 Tax=Burkholderia stagnalis TaxID=1503054 RepID=A0ABX9YQC1_9BURK|nr:MULTISPECIES: hypothetical protein [Burkholderia]MDD1493977.1 hypothetical protein [Burkholderia thailandensis]MPV65642.1 hypothetical protein [Burkholderia sp. BE17]RQY93748.1 hypothetical protein DF017_11920 [Burkholderia stagnalis]RQZ19470.1 hypothetical protein DF016_10340 [Burkholderia stagnalis]